MKYIKGFRLFESHYEDTGWEVNGNKLTIDELNKYLDDNYIGITDVLVDDIKHMCIHVNRKDSDTLKRSEDSNLEYPIIIATKDRQYKSILDGHHRLLKAINNGHDKIKARIFELNDAPDIFNKIFDR